MMIFWHGTLLKMMSRSIFQFNGARITQPPFCKFDREATIACCMTPTLLRRAARLLSPDCPNRALARLVGRKRSTVRSWLSEHRRMPVHLSGILEEELAQRIRSHLAIIQELKQAAWLRGATGAATIAGSFCGAGT